MTTSTTFKRTKTATQVLIVDDAPLVRRELRTLLSLTGELDIVGEATNGLEAIQQIEELQPDVVLMDLEMPVMDGYEATQQIKARHPACRVVALTVHSYDEAHKKALQAGVDAFIVKGTPVDKIVQAITERRIKS